MNSRQLKNQHVENEAEQVGGAWRYNQSQSRTAFDYHMFPRQHDVPHDLHFPDTSKQDLG